MSNKLRKTKRKNRTKSSSDDDSESETSGKGKSSRVNQQKQNYQIKIKALCDSDSGNDKSNKQSNMSRTSYVSQLPAGNKIQMVELDSTDSSNSDSSKPQKRMSKQSKTDTKKRKRKNISSGTSSESSEMPKRHNTRSSKKAKLPVLKSHDKSKNKKISQMKNDSGSSKAPQEQKLKRKTLQESSANYSFNDYLVIHTPSRANEENISVESSQEISFKHYILQEMKKFQKVNSKFCDDLEWSSKYLLDKKISSIANAKFFIHKLLKLYEDAFIKLNDIRTEFVKMYVNWINEVCDNSEEIKKKKRFTLSSDELDSDFQLSNNVSINKVTNNSKLDEQTTLIKSRGKAAESCQLLEAKLTDAFAKLGEASRLPQEQDKSAETVESMGILSANEDIDDSSKTSRLPQEREKSTEIVKSIDVLSETKDIDEPTPGGQKQGKLRLKNSLLKNQSVVSEKSSEESETCSLFPLSGCESEVIFSSEEAKSKRKSNAKKKKIEACEKDNAKQPAAASIITLSESEDDLFNTSTGEVASTPELKKKSASFTRNLENGQNKDKEKVTDSVEKKQPSAAASESSSTPAPVVESNEPKDITDPEELSALSKLQMMISDDSDVQADSEPEEEPEEVQALASTSAMSSKGEAAVQKKKKNLTKQSKIRHLVSSDSSSADDGERSRSMGQRRNNKEAPSVSATFRMAPVFAPPKRVDLTKNRYYLADKKLRQKCRVELEQLPLDELTKHVRALEESERYLELKKIRSLANLDNLEAKRKSKKKADNDGSSEFDANNVKRPGKKNNSKKDEKKSVVDHLGKKSPNDGDESLDEKDERESQTAANHDSLNHVNQSFEQDAESKAKEALLRDTSSSDEFVENEGDADADAKKDKARRGKIKKSKADKNSPANVDSGEEEVDDKKEKSAWRRDKLLTFKLDGSDTEEEEFTQSQEKKKAKQSEAENDKSEKDSNPSKKPKNKRKTRKARRIVDSDSDAASISEDAKENSGSEESDEEPEESSKKKKRQRRAQSSDSDTSSGKKQKAKRRRIKKVASDSDSDDKDSPGKGRRNIRKVLKDKYVTDDTRKAAQDEEERLKRIADRQKLFNDMYKERLAGEKKVDKLVLDIDEETKEELVAVHKGLVKKLKPHQARGIKFMWDACFESIERIKTSEGSGCIIAHCMGLGKTFQVVALAHTLLSHENTGVRTIMIVCPLSTVLNWYNEFEMWLKNVDKNDIEVYELTKRKRNIERRYELENWQRSGGVLIINYEMFRNLTSTGKKMRKNMQESIMKSLVDPGADLIVCDEGHLLKNEDSALSKAMRLVKTMRRIVLTGTPLQNNLKEYHCMVQFVKPNLLGTKKEFLNRFVNPITNGQFDDSTPYDVKLMKKRAHVLHKMLEGSVQRFDYSVLTPFLPPKQEYVIFLRLTEVQIKLYQHYLDNFSRHFGGRTVSLFADFQALQRIWTHPYVLRLNAEKVEKANEKKRFEASDSEGSLKDFIDDDSTSASESSESSSNSNSSDIQCLDSDNENGSSSKRRGTRANPTKQEDPVEQVEETPEEAAWWSQYVEEDQFNDLRISTKLILLFEIISKSERNGDKVLVFSQSLYSLTLIEHFLNLMDEQSQKGEEADNLNGYTGTWSFGVDYFRLDGSTSADNRNAWSKIFNNPKNTRARLFLISTRAGGLGINLIGANKVIIFDASWNPSHDVQSIFRIYRFGQIKPCFVYRFLAAGTMEEKIYNRQVTKLSLSCRVVDEQQIERHYSNTDLAELYQFDTCENQSETLILPQDHMLADIFSKYKSYIVKCHEHDSLLENKEEEELDDEERKQAWAEYEQEKQGIRQQGFNMGNNLAFNQMLMSMNVMPEFQGVKQLLQKDYPDVPPEHLDVLTRQAMFQMYHNIDHQPILGSMNNLRNPLTMPSQNAFTHPTIQDEIFRQQNSMINQPQGNYFGVNQMPTYSGRGRPPKFTPHNNQIVTNPMYSTYAQFQSQLSVPSDEVEVLTEQPVNSSNRQPSSNANN